ncbi:MAG: SAM-dependent methyltransferase [Rubrivivax sp.]|nr:SAM-dependent methyltransferase [Rubrivivax sp.]
MTTSDATDNFITRLRQSLADGSFVHLQLGRPLGGEPTLEKLRARRIVLRGEDQLSLVWRHVSKDITKNLATGAGVDLIAGLIGQPFQHAHLVTRSHDVQLAPDKKGGWRLQVGKLAAAAQPLDDGAHDRDKRRALALDTPFLAELGVADAQHRLVPAMARKWRQINKFAEVLGHAIEQSPLAARDPALPVRVLDFGAGKGYLTFAVHHQLLASGRVPAVTGVELREDLTRLCNAAVSRLGLAGLHFATGDVRSHAAAEVDIMIALHACDIATDVAMHRGVAAGAAIILCSPCCHKELRPQMTAPPRLQAMLSHGIHMTEQAEMLTDTLRALLLQTAGYDTQVFEFVSPEHTHKNKMVLAVRRAQPLPAAQRAALQAQVAELKAYYGVATQTLETLLADEPAPT